MTYNPLDIIKDINPDELQDFVLEGGGGSRGLRPEGDALAVLTGFIELGKQPDSHKGQAKVPCPKYQLIFTIIGGIGVNKEGEEVPFVEAGAKDVWIQRATNAKGGDLATRSKHMSALARASTIRDKASITSFAHLLGQVFTIPVQHSESTDGKTTYANLLVENAAAAPKDPRTRQPLQVWYNLEGEEVPFAELVAEDYKVFFWNKPTSMSTEHYQASWDSLFVEGTWEARKGADGKLQPAQSKNKIQETILAATDYVGSSLDNLLSGTTGDKLPSLETIEPKPTLADVPDADLDDDISF